MKQQKLSQLPRLGNQHSSFFEEGPPPMTGHGGVEADEDFKVSNHNQTKILNDWAAQSGNRYVQSSNQFSTTPVADPG